MDRLKGLLRREAKVDLSHLLPFPRGGYLVGGALRDTLLGRPFSDTDWLAPDPEAAAGEAAQALASSVFVLDPLRNHWRVVKEGESRDYAPLEGDLESNLRGRDFSINALAADAEGRLIDPVQGRRDLHERRIRMLSRANLRADPLRPLRGVRLAAQLGFELEPETAAAMTEEARAQRTGEIMLPAWERVGEELNRLLLSDAAAYGLRLLDETGLLDVYLPELAAAREVEQRGFHHLDVLAHSIEAVKQLVSGFPESPLSLRWATLLHDVGKPGTRTFDPLASQGRHYSFYGHDKAGAELSESLLKRLRQPSERIKRVAGLVRYHMLPLPGSDREARRFLHRRRELLPDLLKVMIADREAARGPLASDKGRERYRLALARILKLMAQAPPAKPLLDGRDVMERLGLGPGPQVGLALRFIREAAAVGDITTKEEAEAALLAYAQGQGWL